MRDGLLQKSLELPKLYVAVAEIMNANDVTRAIEYYRAFVVDNLGSKASVTP